MSETREFRAWRISGFPVLFLVLVVVFFIAVLVKDMIVAQDASILWLPIVLALGVFLSMGGFLVVQPNEARVLVFFGRYAGSTRDAGFWWVNPFTTKAHVSLRVHNFNSERLKVNDLAGNPIEIAAVVVWKVTDSAKARFDVENYSEFVAIQSETAIRSLASHYPYDAHVEGRPSLRGSPDEVSENLTHQVQARLELAGLHISEARISHLAYAPEIAQAMLRRQQAEAIVAARQKIVEGAVGMVESALKLLADQNVVHLDEERKAAMTNNLLVALVSDHEVTPILNTGTLYT
jgi:regulator of protease activity HflC (stomatin/prohibitin superfamily)